MFEPASLPVPSDLLTTIAATLTDLSARVECLDARLTNVLAAEDQAEQPAALSDEWIWEGNRAYRRHTTRSWSGW